MKSGDINLNEYHVIIRTAVLEVVWSSNMNVTLIKFSHVFKLSRD